MKVRHLLFAAILSGLTLTGLIFFGLSRHLMQGSFNSIERLQAEHQMRIVHAALNQQLQSLHSLNTDWGNWDDCYEFAQGMRPEFAASNLQPSGLANSTGLTAVLFLKPDLSVLRLARSDSPLASLLSARAIKEEAERAGLWGETGGTAMMALGGHPFLASVLPIMKSDGSGPSAGQIIMLRSLSGDVKKNLEMAVCRPLQLTIRPAYASRGDSLKDEVVIDEAAATAIVRVRDSSKRTLADLIMSLPLTALAAGREAENWMLIQLVGAGVLLLLIIGSAALPLVRPLEKIGHQLAHMGSGLSGDPIRVRGPYEVNLLVNRLNDLLRIVWEKEQLLVEHQEELISQNDSLEEAVAERTEQIEHQASHDLLTGLPNRALFMKVVSGSISRRRQEGGDLAVLFIDLDNFKLVNDSLGHDVGDSLLVQVGSRLAGAVRGEDCVARLGGDEFTILLASVKGRKEASHAARRIMSCFQAPFALGGKEVNVRACIGIALMSKSLDSPDALLKHADTAMYHAKSQGKSRFIFFGPEMQDEANEKLELESALSRGIMEGCVTAHFQPLVDLVSGCMVGAEALARWTHPARGAIPPSVFIPLAEETGLIEPLGWLILEQACGHAARIAPSYADSAWTVSVNLSPRQFSSDFLLQQVDSILQRTGLEPSRLKLEITESLLVADEAGTISRMRALKERGIKLALDDFGTGYSSLSYLHAFPIDTLKIDRSFIARLEEDAGARAIVQAILAMASSLEIDVTAEGVETEGQAEVLKLMGCSVGQGYYFSKPLPAQEFAVLLSGWSNNLEFEQAA